MCTNHLIIHHYSPHHTLNTSSVIQIHFPFYDSYDFIIKHIKIKKIFNNTDNLFKVSYAFIICEEKNANAFLCGKWYTDFLQGGSDWVNILYTNYIQQNKP